MTPDDVLRWAFAVTITCVLLGLPIGFLCIGAWFAAEAAATATGRWLLRWRAAGHRCRCSDVVEVQR